MIEFNICRLAERCSLATKFIELSQRYSPFVVGARFNRHVLTQTVTSKTAFSRFRIVNEEKGKKKKKIDFPIAEPKTLPARVQLHNQLHWV